MIDLLCCDSMKMMPTLTERIAPSFNMIFLDPPYFEWADSEKPKHNLLSLFATKLLKPNGIVWLCGTQPQLLDDWPYWSRFFKLVFEIIQHKHTGTPPINQWQPSRLHENIWCMIKRKAQVSDTSLDIRRVTKKGKVVTGGRPGGMTIRYGKTWVEWRTGVGYPKSVWTCSQISKGSKEYEGHPTQKPLRLMELIVKISTEESDWVLDPFAGSGSTLIACEESGRNCLGMEISKEYCQTILRRMKRANQIKKLSEFTALNS